jgi:hypothetical protein
MGDSVLRHWEIPCKLDFCPQSKGHQVNIPEAGGGYCTVTFVSSVTPNRASERVIFSF